MHYFEPHRKISNQYSSPKCKKALYYQKDFQCKKVMHAIFFTPKGLAIQVFIPKGKSMNKRLCRKRFLENLSNSTRNVDRRQASVVFICYITLRKSQGWKCDVVLFLVRTGGGGLCSRTFTLIP